MGQSEYKKVQKAGAQSLGEYCDALANIAARAQLDLRPRTKDTGLYILECVRGHYEQHLGCHADEAARDLKLSVHQVRHAVKKLRKEWMDRRLNGNPHPSG